MTPRWTMEAGSSPGPGAATIFGSFLRLGITAFGGPAMIAHIKEMR